MSPGLPLALDFCSVEPLESFDTCDQDKIREWFKQNGALVRENMQEVEEYAGKVFSSISKVLNDNTTSLKQLKLWLIQSIGNLDHKMNTKMHHALFSRFMPNNSLFSSLIVKEIVQLYADETVKLLDRKPHYFQEFFRDSRSRSEGWFQHFHYDGKMLFGARAIERFTFNNRKEFWKELVWSKNSVAPIVAASKQHIYKQVRVYPTVQNLVQVNQFWNSAEFMASIQCRGGGAIFSLDYHFWELTLSSLIHNFDKDPNGEITAGFIALVEKYLESQTFADLCQRFLSTFTDSQLLLFLEEFYKILEEEDQRLGQGEDPSIFLRLMARKWNSVPHLSMVNSMLSYPTRTLSLLEERGDDRSISLEMEELSRFLAASFRARFGDLFFLDSLQTHKNIKKHHMYCIMAHLAVEEALPACDTVKQLETSSIFTFLLLLDVRSYATNSTVSHILDLFRIPFEPVYYEEILSKKEKKKKRRKREKEENAVGGLPPRKKVKTQKHETIHDERIPSAWKLPNKTGSVEAAMNYSGSAEKTMNYSAFDIPQYIATYYASSQTLI